VGIDKDELSPGEVDPVVCQIEEGSVVKVGVGLPVDVQVPILVVNRGGGLRV